MSYHDTVVCIGIEATDDEVTEVYFVGGLLQQWIGSFCVYSQSNYV